MFQSFHAGESYLAQFVNISSISLSFYNRQPIWVIFILLMLPWNSANYVESAMRCYCQVMVERKVQHLMPVDTGSAMSVGDNT